MILRLIGVALLRFSTLIGWADNSRADLQQVGQKYSSHYQEALDAYESVLKIDLSPVNQAEGANNRGDLWLAQGEYEKAIPYFLDAKARMELLGSDRLLTLLLNNLGIAYFDLEQYDSVHHYFALSMAANSGQQIVEAGGQMGMIGLCLLVYI